MASEFRPLREILRELSPLLQQKASGYFFIVTDDNHSCTIRLHGGQIDEVSFSRQRNDEAVQLLSRVCAARARFQPIAIAASGSGHRPCSGCSKASKAICPWQRPPLQ